MNKKCDASISNDAAANCCFQLETDFILSGLEALGLVLVLELVIVLEARLVCYCRYVGPEMQFFMLFVRVQAL